MKSVRSTLLMFAAAALFMGAAPPQPPTVVPNAGPKNAEGLTAVIVATKDTYTLDAATSGKEFRDRLEAMRGGRGGGAGVIGGGRGGRGGGLPNAPAVDLTLRITNTTDKDVTINLGGDDSRLELKLTGPGAVTVDNQVAMTMEFRIGRPVVIAPGKTHDIKISSLSFGQRGISQLAYWTEAGEYTLVATQVYGLGEKQGKVESAPAKIKVEAPK